MDKKLLFYLKKERKEYDTYPISMIYLRNKVCEEKGRKEEI